MATQFSINNVILRINAMQTKNHLLFANLNHLIHEQSLHFNRKIEAIQNNITTNSTYLQTEFTRMLDKAMEDSMENVCELTKALFFDVDEIKKETKTQFNEIRSHFQETDKKIKLLKDQLSSNEEIFEDKVASEIRNVKTHFSLETQLLPILSDSFECSKIENKRYLDFLFNENLGKMFYSYPIVHYCINGSQNITLYDVSAKSKRAITVDKVINRGAESISHGLKIFIIGGNEPLSNTNYELSINENKLVERRPMFLKKYAHSLCIAGDNIYSIGGNDSTFVSDCQKYSIIKNEWNYLPKLITDRGFCASFSFNGNEIYAMGGNSRSGITQTTEKINILNPLKWENVNISNPMIAKCGIHGIQISINEVLIFGNTNGRLLNRIIYIKNWRYSRMHKMQYNEVKHNVLRDSSSGI